MGSPQQNKALVQRFMDAFRDRDPATAAKCFDANKYYSHTYEADLAGTWEQQKTDFRSHVWIDVDSETVALIADGDRVMHQGRFTATHNGEFLGIPATGRRITMDAIETWRIEDDLIVEHWGGFVVTRHLLARLKGEET